MSIEIPQIVKSSTPSCGPVSRTDVPAVTVVEINDPTAIGETMELVEQDVVQLDSKPMRQAMTKYQRTGRNIYISATILGLS